MSSTVTRRKVYVVGVGMTKIERPKKGGRDFPEMAREAVRMALDDAGLSYAQVQAAVCGYCYGDPTCGQRAVYEVGMTGIPVLNVNNNCSTGSTALFTAKTFAQAGTGCVLALGFEKMKKNLSQVYQDNGWGSPTDVHWEKMYEFGTEQAHKGIGVERKLSNERYNEFTDNIIKLYAYAAREHSAKYGSTPKQLAKIAYKNHRQSANNPYALMQRTFPMAVVEGSPTLLEPLTMLQACPTGCGAAAALVCTEQFVERHGLWGSAVEIAGQGLVTDMPGSFKKKSFISLSGFDMAREAARQAYEQAGVTPKDVDVVELHDCFTSNELLMYEALGLCKEGKAGALIDSGVWVKNRGGSEQCRLGKDEAGGGWVINASGGLLSKGHPIGATGLYQCYELCKQLRGQAAKRQVDDATVALQHNFGIGGAAVVTLYKRPEGRSLKSRL